MTILNYEHNTAYEFKNGNSDKLIIYIEGTGYYSVLGWKDNNKWVNVNIGNSIVGLMRDKYTVLIPERLTMQIGVYYYYNPKMRRNYTLENLVESYSSIINTYLSEHTYSSVVLAGSSEGAV
jgi:hypothetical protein